jgi:hypothetical protein
MKPNPFAVLGLPEWPDLDDETVRAAWRAIAADTHPDRADGGDLARYTAATAAFAELNTPWGRTEAYADLLDQDRARAPYDQMDDDLLDDGPVVVFVPVTFVPQPVPLREIVHTAAAVPGRLRRGHPWRLLTRALVLAGACLGVLALFPALPPGPVAAVAAVLLIVSGREDLAPPAPLVDETTSREMKSAGKRKCGTKD